MPVINPVTIKLVTLLIGAMFVMTPVSWIKGSGSGNDMRKPDVTYQDILPKDIGLYVNIMDKDYQGHRLESVIGPNGEQRYDIKVWLKKDKK